MKIAFILIVFLFLYIYKIMEDSIKLRFYGYETILIHLPDQGQGRRTEQGSS